MTDETQPEVVPTRRVLVLNFGPPLRKMSPPAPLPPPAPSRATPVIEKTQPCNPCSNMGQMQSASFTIEAGNVADTRWVPHACVYDFLNEGDAKSWVDNVAAQNFDVVTYLPYPTAE